MGNTEQSQRQTVSKCEFLPVYFIQFHPDWNARARWHCDRPLETIALLIPWVGIQCERKDKRSSGAAPDHSAL